MLLAPFLTLGPTSLVALMAPMMVVMTVLALMIALTLPLLCIFALSIRLNWECFSGCDLTILFFNRHCIIVLLEVSACLGLLLLISNHSGLFRFRFTSLHFSVFTIAGSPYFPGLLRATPIFIMLLGPIILFSRTCMIVLAGRCFIFVFWLALAALVTLTGTATAFAPAPTFFVFPLSPSRLCLLHCGDDLLKCLLLLFIWELHEVALFIYLVFVVFILVALAQRHETLQIFLKTLQCLSNLFGFFLLPNEQLITLWNINLTFAWPCKGSTHAGWPLSSHSSCGIPGISTRLSRMSQKEHYSGIW